jgi:asparagine synthase (glutamine-hydrolysing)
MCGLAGFLQKPKLDSVTSSHLVGRMTSAIARRGPDSDGIWLDPEAGIALGHRRLSILDLSPAGNQPMVSHSGRYVIAFNGEIYNHVDLRTVLEQEGNAPTWRGHSDTETLACGFDVWGIEKTIARTIGMFAIAIWDRSERVLTLVRDRLGEKPLYFGWQHSGATRTFLFGSELKALRAHPACGRAINRDAVVQFMRHGHVGEGNAIYEGLYKLPAGSMARISLAEPDPVVSTYWSGADIARQGATAKCTGTADEKLTALETLLSDAVGRQMMADVPLGAFLSGGIDSSLVVALMQRQTGRRVKTFSIGFHDPRYNEAEFAKRVAAHLDTEHVTLYVGDQELRDIVPRLPEIYDEPFADASQIPTVLVSKLARTQVSVALSGDGGDELFCGYDRYRQGSALMRVVRATPQPLRALASGAARSLPRRFWDKLLDPLITVASGKEPNGQRISRLADYARSRSIEELHRKLVSRWRFPEAVVIGGREPPGLLDPGAIDCGPLSDAERMMMLDMLTYLPDDILTKVDRASMWSSLECRAPLLDHRVVAFAWSLPADMKHRNGQSKWALRQILYRHVPRELIERPKMGFEVPIAAWLRGPLRGWAEAMLAQERIKREGFFDASILNTKWSEHLSGACNWGPQLWNVLMFQSWLERSETTSGCVDATPAIGLAENVQ